MRPKREGATGGDGRGRGGGKRGAFGCLDLSGGREREGGQERRRADHEGRGRRFAPREDGDPAPGEHGGLDHREHEEDLREQDQPVEGAEQPGPATHLLDAADRAGADSHRERRQGDRLAESRLHDTRGPIGRSLQREGQDPTCPEPGGQDVDSLDRHTPRAGLDRGGMSRGRQRDCRRDSKRRLGALPSPRGEDPDTFEDHPRESRPPR